MPRAELTVVLTAIMRFVAESTSWKALLCFGQGYLGLFLPRPVHLVILTLQAN
jgi:hypothetical protein